MGRRRESGESAKISSGLQARIVDLSIRIWKGNRSQMAKELDADQAGISRLLAGQQQPSGRLLEKLAALEQVNPNWLFTGIGQPFLEGASNSRGGWYRPVVDNLLPGAPNEHPEMLTGSSYPIAEAHMSETSYWYRIGVNSPLRNDPSVLRGDLLLFETDAKWTRRASALPGKVIALRINGKKTHQLFIGKTAKDPEDFFQDYEQYPVDTFGEFKNVSLVLFPEYPHLTFKPNETQKKSLLKEISGTVVDIQRVVGVCVKLERTF